MCGLFGYYGRVFPTTITTSAWRDWVAATAIASQFRGTDGFGVFAGRWVGGSLKVRTEKTPLSATDYLLTQKNRVGLVSNLEPTLLLGHVRAATIGKIAHQYSHPHVLEDTDKNEVYAALTHNGTLRNWRRWSARGASSENSDSAAFLAQIYKAGVKETLEDTEGAFAIAYFDCGTHQLTLGKNSERPLWYAELENGVLWSSVPAFVRFGLDFSGAVLHDKQELTWKMVPNNELQHYVYDDKKSKLTITREEYKARTVTYVGEAYAAGSYHSRRGGYTPTDHLNNNHRRSLPPPSTNSHSGYQPRPRVVLTKERGVSGAIKPKKLYLAGHLISRGNVRQWARDFDWKCIADYVHGSRPVAQYAEQVPYSTVRTIVMDEKAEIMTLGSLVNDNINTLAVALGLAINDPRLKHWMQEPLVIQVYSMPTVVAGGLMQDHEASLYINVEDYVGGLTLSRNDDSKEWEGFMPWTSMDKIITYAQGAMILLSRDKLEYPYIHVNHNIHRIPYCKEAIDSTGSMLYVVRDEKREQHVFLPENEWSVLESDAPPHDFIVYPSN